jgi:hyperosmotically inducible protein
MHIINRKYLIPIASLTLLLGIGQTTLAADTDKAEKPASSSLSAAVSDTAITAKVKAQFIDDMRLKDTDISVNTANGVVTLTGTSPSADGRSAAEEITRHIDGVKDVDNQIMTPSLGKQISTETKSVVKKTEQVSSDSWITTKVKSALLADSLTKGFKISVKTTNHVVTLNGTVDTQAAIDKAVTIARQIKGVQDVDATGIKISKN